MKIATDPVSAATVNNEVAIWLSLLKGACIPSDIISGKILTIYL